LHNLIRGGRTHIPTNTRYLCIDIKQGSDIKQVNISVILVGYFISVLQQVV